MGGIPQRCSTRAGSASIGARIASARPSARGVSNCGSVAIWCRCGVAHQPVTRDAATGRLAVAQRPRRGARSPRGRPRVTRGVARHAGAAPQLAARADALLTAADAAVSALAASDRSREASMTATGVGPVVALTFAAVLDDPARFDGDAARASAFLGLVPSEASSGERRLQGHITKAGPSDLRALLVQASWTIWRGRSAAGAELRAWAHALAARRGRRIAIVALARRLSRVLFAMWRDQKDFSVNRRAGPWPRSRTRGRGESRPSGV